MPGSTSRYGIEYPLGTDSAATIDNTLQTSAQTIDNLIGLSPAAGSLFHIAGTDDTSTAQTTTSGSFVAKSDCRVTFTTGESGVFMVNFTAVASNSSGAGITRATFEITGGLVVGPSSVPTVTVEGQSRAGAGFTRIFAGTANTSTVVTLNMLATSGTGTVHDANIQVVNLG
jgi:hypothetical protein